MRLFFFVLFCALLGAFAWDAWHPSSPSAPAPKPSPTTQSAAPATYFLIDASGSMAKLDAEKEVSKILDPIRQANEGALISRTYFRAANEEACRAPIVISEPHAGESEAERQTYRDDFTPTGEALKAAILHAVRGEKPANIYLVSDEDPTPGCGVDVCTVASALLPIDGITVRSVPVFGTNSVAHDRFGCIEAAQRSWQPATAATANTGEEHGSGAKPATFSERWTWLGLFSIVALSALSIGFIDLRRSISLSEKNEQAKSLQDRIEQEDKTATEELEKLRQSEAGLLKLTPPKAKDGDPKTFLKRQQVTLGVAASKVGKWFERSWFAPKFLYLWFGVVALLLLAMGDGRYVLPNYRLGVAQQSAWNVLDTNFATAFAVTWIAIIFFWGSQYQRRREAEHKFLLATKEAERLQAVQEAEAIEELKRKYQRLYSDMEKADFDTPWAVWADYEDKAIFQAHFERVKAEAIDLAMGEKLSEKPTVAEIETKTVRLQRLTSARFGERRNFARFIVRLLAEGDPPDHANEWKDLQTALTAADRTDDRTRDRVRLLAEKLQTDSA